MPAHFSTDPCYREIFLLSHGRAPWWLPTAASPHQVTTSDGLSLPLCLVALQLPPTPPATFNGPSRPLFLLYKSRDILWVLCAKHCFPSWQGSPWQGDATQGAAVMGRFYLFDCSSRAKIFPAVGMLERRPLSARSGSLPHDMGDTVAPSVRHLCAELGKA